ncbi:probable prefoldin subunit 5 [Teleopsis dalmanni]|uniref:probable prefoldin subunit 5 n=1 Tax=Teleopsis dalmanni TaxID=139649 RepID=UPI0018CD794F|nr:probable prefoldin subunit 5 [Teleopsis dalmanni]
MASTSEDEALVQVDLTTWSLDQLFGMKHTVEQECAVLKESQQALQDCKEKFVASKEALDAIQPNWENREVLVPLTSSLYVNGRIKDPNNVLLNIGAGYYIEKNLDESKEYLEKRIVYVQEQIEKVEKVRLHKVMFIDAIVGVLEMKKKAASNQS